MSVIYSSSFPADSNTALLSYGVPDWYSVYPVGDRLEVTASADNVQMQVGLNFEYVALVDSLNGGVSDYTWSGRIRRGVGVESGVLGVRSGGVTSQSFYRVTPNASHGIVIERYNAGASTSLKTTVGALAEGAEFDAFITVTGTNPVVLTYGIGSVTDSYSDTDAGRLQSGPPGIGVIRQFGEQSDAWVDDVSLSEIVAVRSPGAGSAKRRGPGKYEVEWDGKVRVFPNAFDAEAWVETQAEKRRKEQALARAKERARIAAIVKLDAPSDYRPLVNTFWTPED